MKRDMDLCIKLLKLVQSHPRASVSVQSHEEVTEAMRNGSLPEGREQKIVEAPRDCDTDKLEYHIDLLRRPTY